MRKPVKYRAGTGVATEGAPAAGLAGSAALAVAAPVSAEAAANVAKKPSFERDIRPMFEPFAAAMMWRLDLTNYRAVLANAQTISERISDPGNPMPPPPFPMLTSDQIALFKSWMDNGCKP